MHDGPDFLQLVNPTVVNVDDSGNATLTFDTETSALMGVRLNGLPYNDALCTNGEKDYHRILWTIEDGCGAASQCEYLFRLEDCKAPSPVCMGLSTIVMLPAGEVSVWASDFNASSNDDCTSADALVYSFSENAYTPSMSFDCDAIEQNGSNTFEVTVWAADAGNDQNCDGVISWDERNKAFCLMSVVIDDTGGACGGGMAGGLIETEELESVENVTVKLMDQSGDVMEQFVTDGTGLYEFLNPLLSYTIEPVRNDDHSNGVSTLDLVRIQKHLLGAEPFVSPYKLIAADANNSESVTALDLVEIRRLILGLNNEFPNNTSWRFVDAGFDFPDEYSPWPFDETVEIGEEFGEQEDFIAVKVGDVNGTVAANAKPVDVRSPGDALRFVTSDRSIDVGEDVIIDIAASDFDAINGFQYTMSTPGLEIQSIDAGAIDMQLANVGVHKQSITMSWHRAEPVSINTGERLYTMQFKATKAGTLSEMLSITSKITDAEAYRADGGLTEIVDVIIEFEEVQEQSSFEFELYQNEPNPFNEATTVGFTLPHAMDARLTVFDMHGKVIKVIEAAYDVGYNQIKLYQHDLGTAGVLYYRLDAGLLSTSGGRQFSAAKKLIIIQ